MRGRWQKVLDLYLPRPRHASEAIVLSLLVTFVFLLIEYFGWQRPFHQLFAQTHFYFKLITRERHFYAQLWTTVSFLVFLVIVPTVTLKLFFKREHFNWMTGVGNQASSWKLYTLAYIVMLGPLLVAASNPAFYNFYPLYRPASGSDWFWFELIYLPQFFAVEFFFRGPLLSWCEKKVGELAPYIMVFPYALIHIHKPFGEALGSIVAGLVLGHLALKSRSIWGGVVLHMMVALTMDSAALYFAGFFTY